MTRSADDRVLILLRHAKAEQTPGKPDHDRELTGRGRRDARAAGAWLREQGLGPELVLCSTAVRTRQTWEEAVAGGARGEFVSYDRTVYTGGVPGVLEAIQTSAREEQVVLVIGHNPTMAMLASMLSDGDGSAAAHEVLADGLPTSAIAVLHFTGPWAGLSGGGAMLARCHVCRG